MEMLCWEAHLNGTLRMKRIAIQRENLERQSMQAEMQDNAEAGWLDQIDISRQAC